MFITLLLITITSASGDNVLTTNFFDNLRGDPKLMADYELGTISKEFIEHQINNYVDLMEKTSQKGLLVKTKRSLSEEVLGLADMFLETKIDLSEELCKNINVEGNVFTKKVYPIVKCLGRSVLIRQNDDIVYSQPISCDTQGTYLLEDVIPTSEILPANFPEDIHYFYNNQTRYSAALERSEITQSLSNFLVIYDDSSNEIARRKIVKGVKIASISINETTLIAVAENETSREDFESKSAIFEFTPNELKKIQSLDMYYATDVAMWRIHDDIFMSMAHYCANKNNYEVETPIYRWKGGHFDLVQKVATKGARKIEHFSIDNSHFLAVANSRDNSGNTKVYSDIYKYDFGSEKFELYQRILTSACVDIKFFQFSWEDDRFKDNFLIAANSLEDCILYKFVDNYFIPFQTIQVDEIQEWLPIKGPKEEFVLFASTLHNGLIAFQYDGWAFQEVPQEFDKATRLKQQGITSIRSLSLGNRSTLLVVANRYNRGNSPNLFHLKFKHHNYLNKIQEDMLDWCRGGLSKVQDLHENFVVGQRADIEVESSSNEDQLSIEDLEKINTKIGSLNQILTKIELEIEKSTQNNTPKQINFDGITADKIIFKNDTTFKDEVLIDTVNNRDMSQMLENTLNIAKGFEQDHMTLQSTIAKDVTTQTINKQPILNVMSQDLTIAGRLKTPEIRADFINNVTIDDKTTLLVEGDQELSTLNAEWIEVDNVRTKTMNGVPLDQLSRSEQTVEVNQIRNLKVKNLVLGGLVNEVDISTLDKYALKVVGDQEIKSPYIFEQLTVSNVDVDTINGRNTSELISTDSGSYVINQNMIFEQTFHVHDLKISRSINEIVINDGEMDVLLKDHPWEQIVRGEKTFDYVAVMDQITLRTKINNTEFDKFNPLVEIDRNLFIDGDRSISGEVAVENEGLFNDIDSVSRNFSIQKLVENAIKLGDSEVWPNLRFVQQLTPGEVFVETINNLGVDKFVVNGQEVPQIVEGLKIFDGDLEITGETTAYEINDIKVNELENVLKIHGDQVIEGRVEVKNAFVEDRIAANQTNFGVEQWNATFSKDLNETVTYNGNLDLRTVITEHLTVAGLINDMPVDEMLSQNTATWPKTCENFTVHSLIVRNGLTMSGLDQIVDEEKNEIKLPHSHKEVMIKTPIVVQNLYFEDQFNGIAKSNFTKMDVNDMGALVVDGRKFDDVVVYGNVFISSNMINGIEIDQLVNGSVKIDEPNHLESVTFRSTVISDSSVVLEGHIEHVDLDNIPSNSDSEVVFNDEINFKNLTVQRGSIYLSGFVNDFNVTRFCLFTADDDEAPKNLTVKGNAFFAKGPNVANINNVDMRTIVQRAWFKNQLTNLSGDVHFDNVTFKNDLHVKGLLDEVPLKWLSENYFSKSKDQNITLATFENVVSESVITAPKIDVNGKINGLLIDQLLQTLLLNGYDQIFETKPYLENVTIHELEGKFSVNGLDLEHDVMRYDKTNMVTGTKTFENLKARSLRIEKRIKVQGVDILDWFKSTVLTNGFYNINGTKTINNASFLNGFMLNGNLNGMEIDKIMTRNVAQNITGSKSIRSTLLDPVMFTKGIKLRGKVNDMDISDMINVQAYRNRDNVFKTAINFNQSIVTNNLVFEKNFQGVNVSRLLLNIRNLGALNNLLEKYKYLLDMSYIMQNSLEGRAHYLHHFELVQEIAQVDNSTTTNWKDGSRKIFTTYQNNTFVRANLLGWNKARSSFEVDASINLKNGLNYVEEVFMGNYLYMEFVGKVGHLINTRTDLEKTLSTPQSVGSTSFKNPLSGEVCTLYFYFDSNPLIYCEVGEKIVMRNSLEIPAYKGTSFTIKNTLYLILMVKSDSDPQITILKQHRASEFGVHQVIYAAAPQSVATVSHDSEHYLAVASGHLRNANYFGGVEIRRLDRNTEQWTMWQSLEISAPTQVEFCKLQSGESMLYVVTSNPIEPLIVFRHEGLVGFRKIITGSVLPMIRYINQFIISEQEGSSRYFILAQGQKEVYVIEAVFKGGK